MCAKNAVNAVSEIQILQIFRGACPHTPLGGLCLRHCSSSPPLVEKIISSTVRH